jgi:predicted nucleic acid-binding protein
LTPISSFTCFAATIPYRTYCKEKPEEEQQGQALLDECVILPLTNEMKKVYVSLRKTYQLKLADAMIAATAISSGIPLITADKQFRKVTEINLIAYEI